MIAKPMKTFELHYPMIQFLQFFFLQFLASVQICHWKFKIKSDQILNVQDLVLTEFFPLRFFRPKNHACYEEFTL